MRKISRTMKQDPHQLKPGPICHPEGLGKSTEWCRNLFHRVGYLTCETFEEWERDFMREVDLQRELLIWEGIARAFEAWMDKHPTDDPLSTANIFLAITLGDNSSPSHRLHFEQIHNELTEELLRGKKSHNRSDGS